VHLSNWLETNLGHTLSRIIGHRKALRRELQELDGSSSEQALARVVTLFALPRVEHDIGEHRLHLPPGKRHTFMDNHKIRVFAPELSKSWLQVNFSSTSANDTSDQLLCFHRAFWGMHTPAQWHKDRIPFMKAPKDRLSRHDAYATSIHTEFADSFASLKRDLLLRHGIAPTMKRSFVGESRALAVVWVGRRGSRRVEGEEAAVATATKSFIADRGTATISLRHVFFEDLPVAKQLALVANADILVGTHGAGLTWSFLLDPGSVLVEFASSLYMPCTPVGVNVGAYCPFGHMAAIVGVTHFSQRLYVTKTNGTGGASGGLRFHYTCAVPAGPQEDGCVDEGSDSAALTAARLRRVLDAAVEAWRDPAAVEKDRFVDLI
jgi:hypothetical protein